MRCVSVIGLILVLFQSNHADAQCTKDTDCKGDRVCDVGECVNPHIERSIRQNHSDSTAEDSEASTEAANSHYKLDTSQGTVFLGGEVLFDVVHISSNGKSATGVTINVSPAFGIFVIDNLSLRVAASVSVPLGEFYEGDGSSYGFALGAGYAFNFGSTVVPVVGVNLGAVFIDPSNGKTATSFVLGIPLGIAIALNRHVSLGLGVALQVAIGVSNFDATLIRVAPGYTGISGYF